MNPQALIGTIRAALLQRPPPGVGTDDIDGFFHRHREALAQVIEGELLRSRAGAPTILPAPLKGAPHALLFRVHHEPIGYLDVHRIEEALDSDCGALLRRLRSRLGAQCQDIAVVADVWIHPSLRLKGHGLTLYRVAAREAARRGYALAPHHCTDEGWTDQTLRIWQRLKGDFAYEETPRRIVLWGGGEGVEWPVDSTSILGLIRGRFGDPQGARRFIDAVFEALWADAELHRLFGTSRGSGVTSFSLSLAARTDAELERRRETWPPFVEWLEGDGEAKTALLTWFAGAWEHRVASQTPTGPEPSAADRDREEEGPPWDALGEILGRLMGDGILAEQRRVNDRRNFSLVFSEKVEDGVADLFPAHPDFVNRYFAEPALRASVLEWMMDSWDRRAAEGTQPALPSEMSGIPTLWEGRRGDALDPEHVEKGQRVVTAAGEHGVVQRVARYNFVTTTWGEDGVAVRQVEPRPPIFDVRLDTVRMLYSQSSLFEERLPPARIVPDLDLGDGAPLSPGEAWETVATLHRDIAHYEERAQRARKPRSIQEHQLMAKSARRRLLDAFTRFKAWRAAWPDVSVKGLDPRLYRELELSVGVDDPTAAERTELAQVRRAPTDWATRWSPGAPILYFHPGEGRPGDPPRRRGILQGLDGHEGILDSGERVPLWLVHLDPLGVTARPAEVFDGPRYIVDLGKEMTVGEHYPRRGAVAKALKAWLEEAGVNVRTRVNQGSMITYITLKSAHGRPWTDAERGTLGRLLGGHRIDPSEITIDPWAREPEAWDPGMDYGPRQGGVALPGHHIGRFAGILAREIKAAGQSLSPLGERRLLTLSPPPRRDTEAAEMPPPSVEEGCVDLSFDVASYGTVRVVCGQRGRRDTWHNIHCQGVRYGFNGRRWAKGMRPPREVLEAVRGRGINAFGEG